MKLPALALFLLPLVAARAGAGVTPEAVEFFEKRIRPVLAQDCYECHSTYGKRKAGLALDSRPGWQEGGDSGPAIVPGEVRESLLLRAIRHEDKDLQMPRKGAKLEESVIADFEKWVAMGAPDPRETPATAEEIARDTDWSAVLQRRKGWWSFQPIAHPAVPGATAWSAQPIDRFLESRWRAAGLEVAKDAEPRLIYRRLCYVLTGLPPKPEETAAFVAAAASDSQGAVETAADRLLASPRFGECWARHWMDWVRYAETHGSEGDPEIPYAWRYRDYLIRALNADVSFPQLVREHLAGDLLEHPRIDPERGINESALGAAHFRMVLHGFTPTDPLDELATFTDNQIDTVSKAFLGLTVACARCHNHKFDAISQADYYALFGVFASCRPATVDVNTPETRERGIAQVQTAKEELRHVVAAAWLQREGEVPARLEQWKPGDDEKEKAAWLAEGAGALAPWLTLKDLPPEKWEHGWKRLRTQWQSAGERLAAFRAQPAWASWDLRGPDFGEWQSAGAGLANGPSAAGAFAVATNGDKVIAGIYPAGVYSHLVSDRQAAMLASPRFAAQGGKLWVRVRGEGDARARYVVRNYPRTGTVYPKKDLAAPADQWVSWPLDYWSGDSLHLEISAEADQPVETKKQERSWFGVTEVLYAKDPTAAPPLPGASLVAFVPESAPTSRAELAELYRAALHRCVERWAAGAMTDAEADFLDTCLRAGLLPNRAAELPEAAAALEAWRKAEAALAAPTRAPGLLEGYAFDQPLFTRGDHKQPAEPVPRRFLEALDPAPFGTGERESGRRQLAESILSPRNPLTPRVIANRLWLYVFGQGLVATPDNFGRLGEPPAQPELLDYLASDFEAHGGSIKSYLRMLVTSRTFRLDARASAAAAERDPENRLLTHAAPRRLEAEAIRDSMLALTGKLDLALGGEASGKAYRRSVYERVIRNHLDPLLTAFDFPVPTATRGRRDATNVPAQALALLNNPEVNRWARDWALRTAGDASLTSDQARVTGMFQEAFGRAPEPVELAQSLALLGAESPDWPGLALALFNAKEFIFLR